MYLIYVCLLYATYYITRRIKREDETQKMFHVKQRRGQTAKPAPSAVDVGVKEKDMVS